MPDVKARVAAERPAPVVFGIGQPMAGDDGVGVEVAHRLAADGIAVRVAADALPILSLLDDGLRVVVIDAMVGTGRPGDVVVLRGGDLAAGVASAAPVSSHGLGLADVISLARALHGDGAAEAVTVVGIVIERPRQLCAGLSPAIAAAIEPAARLVRDFISNR